MDFILHNYLALGAFFTALAALLGLYLQGKRDAADEVTKRISAASQIVKAAVDLTGPLDQRLLVLEKDNETLKEIVQQQSKSYDTLNAKYDQVQYELRAVRADRDNLLAEWIIFQKRIDGQDIIIKGLECRIRELEKDGETLKEIVRQQSASYDNLQAKYDQVLCDLREARADRDGLLAERVAFQKRIEEQTIIIEGLKCRIDELERDFAPMRTHGNVSNL